MFSTVLLVYFVLYKLDLVPLFLQTSNNFPHDIPMGNLFAVVRVEEILAIGSKFLKKDIDEFLYFCLIWPEVDHNGQGNFLKIVVEAPERIEEIPVTFKCLQN